MPTYEYACKKCGEVFDVVQSFSDDPLKRHKGCGGTVKRVFSSVGISFKGSGFYKTDSRSSSSGSGGGSKSNGESKSSEGSSSDTKSDAKSDAKPESKPKPKSDTASTTS
jgi:putative FmdB family regulatory protein